MAENSKISWCDHTFNAWIGCSEATFMVEGQEVDHQGCVNCYAKAMAAFRGWAEWGAGKPRHVTSPATWRKPYRWAQQAAEAGKPALVFCMSLGDILDPDAPVDAQVALWRVIADTACTLRWLLLTKQVADVEIIPESIRHACWIGTSISDQPSADALVPLLLAAKGFAGRFLSVAPQVAAITPRDGWLGKNAVSWVLQEGESGPKARPFDVDWARTWRDASRAAGVPYHLKQLGSYVACVHCGEKAACIGVYEDPEERPLPACDECCGHGCEDGWCTPLEHKSGGDTSEWPEDLRVQEFPKEFRQ